ncbi:MAG: hypothetical protein RPU91_05990, partial [Candidatus Sedimenticola sp. (ex Thyasira tokunagai)]
MGISASLAFSGSGAIVNNRVITAGGTEIDGIKMQSSRFKMENFRQSGFSPIIVILILVVLMISAFLWFKQSQPELPNYTKPYEKVTMGISAT